MAEAGLHSRVDALLKSLDEARAARPVGTTEAAASPANEWRLRPNQGLRRGAQDADKSDEDDDKDDDADARAARAAAAAMSQRLRQTGGDDYNDGDSDGAYLAGASCEYLRAFDREQEEDAYDRAAEGGGGGGDDDDKGGAGNKSTLQRPSGSTPVLAGNAFDRAIALRRGSGRPSSSEEEQEEEERPAAAGAPSAAAAAGPTPPAARRPNLSAQPLKSSIKKRRPVSGGSDGAEEAPGAGAMDAEGVAVEGGGPAAGEQQQQQQQRVRFSGPGFWVPPHRRPGFKPLLAGPSSLGPEGDGGGGGDLLAPPGRQEQQPQQQQQSADPDPDAPPRWLVYELDEPVTVGGGYAPGALGRSGPVEEAQRETRRAVADAAEAAAVAVGPAQEAAEAPLDLPERVEFRPRARPATQQGRAASAVGAGRPPIRSAMMAAAEDEQEQDDDVDGMVG